MFNLFVDNSFNFTLMYSNFIISVLLNFKFVNTFYNLTRNIFYTCGS